MKNKLVTFKLDESIRDHATKMKRLYNYPTYDDLFQDIFKFFIDNETSPRDANISLHKQIFEMKRSLSKIHSEFINKRLNPTLFEIKTQYINTNKTIIEMINQTNSNTHKVIEIAESLSIAPQKEAPQNNINLEDIKSKILELDKVKKSKFNGEKNIVEIDLVEYNRLMDQLKLKLNNF
ncbi:hypothetical protein SAMN05421738_107140 [Algoriella xinjiangensis]|uniref:Uncharacterized protein n=1 Tax=Algoriella xinjiangensis TaxID=684065 RepID=A0A1I4WQV7_9FLAO|nr:hypothetical protein [Algoriella xinjiangensis]SFN16168.1 hypothetical protein SAMN05421738_107140 [Algoriella xinjiangensis]